MKAFITMTLLQAFAIACLDPQTPVSRYDEPPVATASKDSADHNPMDEAKGPQEGEFATDQDDSAEAAPNMIRVKIQMPAIDDIAPMVDLDEGITDYGITLISEAPCDEIILESNPYEGEAKTIEYSVDRECSYLLRVELGEAEGEEVHDSMMEESDSMDSMTIEVERPEELTQDPAPRDQAPQPVAEDPGAPEAEPEPPRNLVTFGAVEPILENSCVACHGDGGIKPNLVNIQSVRDNIDIILDRMQREAGQIGVMPPGQPLSQNDIDPLIAWQSDGLLDSAMMLQSFDVEVSNEDVLIDNLLGNPVLIQPFARFEVPEEAGGAIKLNIELEKAP